MAVPLAAAALGAKTAISAVGNIVAGFGSWQASRARAAALKAAAKQARGDASMAAQMASDEAERTAARAAVMGAASGGGFGGSFGAALEQMERTGVFNARSAIYAGNVEVRNRLYEAKVAKQEGNYALASSVLQATSTIAGDRMRAAEQRKQTDWRKQGYAQGYGR